jgi:hypothetical protein
VLAGSRREFLVKVKHLSGWEDKEGERIDYYEVGIWSMELLSYELDEEIRSAKESVKAFKTWHRFLKKQRRKNK